MGLRRRHDARSGLSAEKYPVRGQPELSGHFQNPAVGNAPLAASLTHGLRRHAEKLGKLAVAPKSGSLEEAIESFRCCAVHESIFKVREQKSQLKIEKI